MRQSVNAMKAHRVTGEFDSASAHYDRLVSLNPGYHRDLRASAARLRLPRNGRGLRIIDLGCGTGASTRALVALYPEAEVVGVDASEGMLAQARAKTWSCRVRFVHARAEELTNEDTGGRADAVFAAYLLRNCPDPDAALAGMRALLKPGGRLVVHEYSVADSVVARATWSLVCGLVIIPLGSAVTGSGYLYRYLWRSVLGFDGAARLRRRLRGSGLENVRTVALPGWQRGIVHTFLGREPATGGTAT